MSTLGYSPRHSSVTRLGVVACWFELSDDDDVGGNGMRTLVDVDGVDEDEEVGLGLALGLIE